MSFDTLARELKIHGQLRKNSAAYEHIPIMSLLVLKFINTWNGYGFYASIGDRLLYVIED